VLYSTFVDSSSIGILFFFDCSKMPITINFKTSTGTNFSVETDENILVGDFKQKLVEQSKIPVEQQRLIYSGHVLKDAQSLSSYSLKDGHTVHLVRGASNNTSNQTFTAPPTTTQPTTPSNANPFGGFGGLGGLGGLGGSNFQQMQQQLMQNPNMMRELMNSPMMQSMLQNPELIRSMLLNNPQMRDVIERNPEVGHVLNDPQILRQTLEMARNPELMREMMRNTDRAMNNIESHPEGFNLLRRMYTNVQEPLLNAATPNNQTANPFAALFGGTGGGTSEVTPQQNTSTPSSAPNTAPLPNPWGGSSPSISTPTVQSNNPSSTSNPPPNPFGGLGVDPSLFDPNTMASMMQNPGVQSMMQQMFSNPELVQQAVTSNPLLSSMMQQNPMMQQMLQNPEFLRQMSDPNTMNALLQMQNAMQQLQGTGLMNMFNSPFQMPQGETQNTTGGSTTPNLFSQFGIPQTQAPTTTSPQQPPEERFKTQLEQLKEMGFYDQQANIRALEATGGNVQLAIERLLLS